MDEQRVREIVREELADIRKEAAAATTADETKVRDADGSIRVNPLQTK